MNSSLLIFTLLLLVTKVEGSTSEFFEVDQEVIITEIDCRPNPNVLSQLTVPCFFDRKTTAFDEVENGMEYLKQDLGVCGCLRQTHLTKDVMSGKKSLAGIEVDETVKRSNEVSSFTLEMQLMLDRVKRRMQTKKDALFFQSFFFSGANLENPIYKIYDLMGPTRLPADEEGALRRMLPKKASRRADRELTAEERSNLDNVIISSPPTDMAKVIMTENVGDFLEGESCIPMKSFLAYNQFPSEQEFWEDLTKMDKFVPHEWNYDSLKSQLAEANRELSRARNKASAEKKVRGIKARLTFLNKNPMVKYTFAASGEESFGQEEGKNTKVVQNELFQIILKNLKPKDSSCLNKDKGCQHQFNQGEGAKEFRKEGGDFFSQKYVMEAINEEIHKDLSGEAKSMIQDTDKEEEELSQNKFGEILLQETKFNIRTCQGRNAPLIECVESFYHYCRMIEKEKTKIQRAVAAPIDYEKEWINEINQNPLDNKKYQEYSQQVCNSPFINRETRKMVDYDHWKRDYCEPEKNKADCSSKEKLLSLFLKHNRPAGASDLLETGSAFLKDEDSGLASSFGDFLGNSGEIPSISKNELKSLEKNKFADFKTALDSLHQSRVATSSESIISEEGFTSVLSNIAENMGEATVSSESQQISNFYSSASAPSAQSEGEIREVQKMNDEARRQKEEVQEELTAARNKLNSAADEIARSSLENRVKMLEQLLAQKDRIAQNYQKLSDRLISESGPASSRTQASKPQSEVAAIAASPNREAPAVSNSFEEADTAAKRGPASFGETTGATTGSAASAQAAFSSNSQNSQSTARGQFNDVLLSKYGIMVRDDADSNLLVAQESELQKLEILNSKADSKSHPFEVPPSQFEKFRSNDLDSLMELYNNRIKSLSGNIVKLSITSKGEKDSLEFYAIKEGDKVIFQPVRAARLNELKLILPRSEGEFTASK